MQYVKCVVVGHPFVGKTAMVRTYVGDKRWPGLYDTTEGFETCLVDVTVDGRPCHLALWDMSGLEDYDRLRPLTYPDTDVLLVCFAVHDDGSSLAAISQKWVPEIKQYCPKVPFILVGTKIDCRNDESATKELSETKQEPVTMQKGQEIAKDIGAVKYVECSAKTQEGLANAFEELIRAVPAISVPPKQTLNVIKYQQLQLLDMIGQGGFGSVFQGKWKARKGEVVAVKKCTMSGTKQEPDIPQEVQILSSIPKHPYIISFYGVCKNYPDIFIVTEFAQEGSLFNYLHKEKQVPYSSLSLTWAQQVAHGMEYLHSYDIIHRDLKSANILLSGNFMTAKVCDFGTARYLSHTTVQTNASGTFRWMAPEVMEAVEAKINKKCDSFSYGMVVYELLVHQVPYYDTPGDGVVCVKVMQGEWPAIPPTIPQYLHSLLTACWEKDPHKRPTFHDIIVVLQKKSL